MRKQQRKTIDKEIRCVVDYINENTPFKTLGSCCGHKKYYPTIIVSHPLTEKRYEIFSGLEIPRKKKFYKRDKTGEYYIPEVVQYYSTHLNKK